MINNWLINVMNFDFTINYKEKKWSDEISPKSIDLILDCIGGSYWKGNMKALDTDGIIVLYGLLGGVKGFGLKFGLNFAC